MTRYVLWLAIVLLITGFPTQADDRKWLQHHAERVRLDAIKHNIPGYILVYVEKDKPATFYRYGKTERSGARIDKDTVFRLASVSKTFTAMLMAKLVESNRLDWKTSISTMAPDYGFSQAGLDKMTLGHLVSQSSGFTPNAYDNLIEANYSVKRVLNMLADLEPLCSPGKCYTYQNALFGVIEDYFSANKSSYNIELKRQIIQPLGMPNASAGKAALLSSKKWAKPHIAITRSKWRKGNVQSNYYRFSPAAGVNASIKDMEVWLRAMLGEYPQQVSPSMVATLTTPKVKTKRELNRREWREHLQDAYYGLGWRVYDFDGYKLNYHGGWVKGYRADVAFAPDQQVGYAMLMNAESNLINGFSAEFWETYFEQYKKQSSVVGLLDQVSDE